jgi:hypothetical protein
MRLVEGLDHAASTLNAMRQKAWTAAEGLLRGCDLAVGHWQRV